MKPPPLLLGATLLFWGWQTGFFLPGALMAVILEAARVVQTKWDFSDDDFARIWTFCALLFLASAVYAFTANEGPAEFRGFFLNPNFFTQRNAGTATARSAAALSRWLPMLFFLFVAAQEYSPRGGIPLRTLGLILSTRWKKARRAGQPAVPVRQVNISYAYFALCLFAASVHVSEDTTFFWGLCALLAWGLWPCRSRRFALPLWAAVLALVFASGYYGQRGLGRLQGYLSSLNPQWFSSSSRHRFDSTQNHTELGNLGRLKTSGKIVIRLNTKAGPPPWLLREASYVIYRGRTWYADLAEKDFAEVKAEEDQTTYVLLRNKTNRTSVNISCYLAGGKALLPLPSGTGRLENLGAYVLSSSPLGAVLDQGPGVVIFDAFYGPGMPTLDSAPDLTQDLNVPFKEQATLDQLVADLHLKGQPPEAACRTLAQFFGQHFTYSTWQEVPRNRHTEETALTRFLLESHKGHCEYFATAGALLLRRAGMPTRYAVGYAVHEGARGNYVVRQRDAHAWCLVWDANTRTWRDVDFTPAAWLEAEAQRASPLQFLGDWWSRIVFEISKVRWGQSHLREYIFWALVPVLGLLLYQILFRSRRRRRSSSAPVAEQFNWPGLDSEFFKLERKLSQRGPARDLSEPLSAWLQRAAMEPGLAQMQSPLQQLLRLHYRYRFDPQGLSALERQQLQQAVTSCLAQLDTLEAEALVRA